MTEWATTPCSLGQNKEHILPSLARPGRGTPLSAESQATLAVGPTFHAEKLYVFCEMKASDRREKAVLFMTPGGLSHQSDAAAFFFSLRDLARF